MVEVRDVRQSFMSGSGLRVKILTFTSNGSTKVECLHGSLAQRQPDKRCVGLVSSVIRRMV